MSKTNVGTPVAPTATGFFEVEYVKLHADPFVAGSGQLGTTLTDSPLKGMKIVANAVDLSIVVEYEGKQIYIPSSNIVCMVKKRK